MFGLHLASRRAINVVAAVILVGGLAAGTSFAQSDDAQSDPPPPSVSQPPRPPIDTSAGHHGGGGGDDNDAALPSLRNDRGPSAGMRIEATAGTGLAMDSSPLPGELGSTPEAGRPLFDKPSPGLAMRPDPWAVTPKP